VDHAGVTVQPAGPAGKRYVYLSVSFDDHDNSVRQLEFVLPEQAALRLGEALISGSVGIMREFSLPDVSDCS
jgi:hypothetical protein